MGDRKKRVDRKPRPSQIADSGRFYFDKFQISPQEFYGRIERWFEERRIAGLEMERVDWPEGGVLSPMREYLRVTRDRVVFDICGAPFGTGFCVSVWFGQRLPSLGLPAVLLLIALLFAGIDSFLRLPNGLHQLLERTLQISWLGATLFLGIWLFILTIHLIRTGRLRQEDVDAVFLRIPGVAWIYLRYFRRVTFYRVDQQCCYLSIVPEAIRQVLNDLTEGTQTQAPSGPIISPQIKEYFLLPLQNNDDDQPRE